MEKLQILVDIRLVKKERCRTKAVVFDFALTKTIDYCDKTKSTL